MHAGNAGIRAVLSGIFINLLLVVAKGVAGTLGHSYALIADAIESLSDVVTSFIVYIGLKVAAKAPDHDHPYGHGKAEPLATIIVAIALLAAAIFIAVHSFIFILTPHPAPHKFTLLVLAAVIVIKELLSRYVHSAAEAINSSAVKADAIHHRMDVVVSVTAFIGITIAILGGKGYEIADDVAALFAALFMAFNSYQIFLPAFNEIMDAAPSPHIADDIRKIAATVPRVIEVEKCIVRKMGTRYWVDLHLVVNQNLSVREGHDIAHAAKDTILAQQPFVYDVLIHIEPNEEQ